ncbi:MAG TPA: response regulator [Negativicutes bacterium]|nr:response regulator [Negativicutes bacterium]
MAKILIVDDSTTIRVLLRDTLTAAGHHVIGEADTGVKAYIEYVRLKPDVVTMDLDMPTMNGLAAMSKILAPFPDARFLVVSAIGQKNIIEEALERGARGFLLKPFTEEQVAEAVVSVMKQPFTTSEFREKVRRHRRTLKGDAKADETVDEVVSPYNLVMAGNGELRVEINAHFSKDSCAALALESKYLCQEKATRLTFDFGSIARIDIQALVALNALMNELYQTCGGVTAIAGNEKLVHQIQDEHDENGKLPFLLLLMEEGRKI